MRKSLCELRSITAAVAILTAAWPTLVSAQTTVYSTFGPGDSHLPIGSLVYGSVPGQSLAQSFTYTGTNGWGLARIRLALGAAGADYSVSFWHGSDLNSASLLESWSVGAPGDGIYALTSIGMPGLTTGDTYWVAVANSVSIATPGQWLANDQGILGISGYYGGFEPYWHSPILSANSSAFDVAAVPEPGSLALVCTGLLGLTFVARRRRIG